MKIKFWNRYENTTKSKKKIHLLFAYENNRKCNFKKCSYNINCIYFISTYLKCVSLSSITSVVICLLLHLLCAYYIHALDLLILFSLSLMYYLLILRKIQREWANKYWKCTNMHIPVFFYPHICLIHTVLWCYYSKVNLSPLFITGFPCTNFKIYQPNKNYMMLWCFFCVHTKYILCQFTFVLNVQIPHSHIPLHISISISVHIWILILWTQNQIYSMCT